MDGRSYSSGFRQLDKQLDRGYPPGSVVTLVAPAYTSGELVVEEFALDEDHQTVYVATHGEGVLSQRIRESAGGNTHVVRPYADLPAGLSSALTPPDDGERGTETDADGDCDSHADGGPAGDPDADDEPVDEAAADDGAADDRTAGDGQAGDGPTSGDEPVADGSGEPRDRLDDGPPGRGGASDTSAAETDEVTRHRETASEPDEAAGSKTAAGENGDTGGRRSAAIDRPSIVVDTANGLFDATEDLTGELAGLRDLVETQSGVCLCHLQAQLDDLSLSERTLLKASDGVLYYDHDPHSPDADHLMVSEFRGITPRETQFRLEYTRGTIGINADREF